MSATVMPDRFPVPRPKLCVAGIPAPVLRPLLRAGPGQRCADCLRRPRLRGHQLPSPPGRGVDSQHRPDRFGGGAHDQWVTQAAPVCAPTRAGLLTGRYQQRFGFYTAADSRAGLPTSETTLADLLRDAGYATGVFGKWHLGYQPRFRPLRRGFGTFYGFLGHGGHDYFDLSVTDEVRSIYLNSAPVDDTGYLTRNITRHAVKFIGQNANRPFFAYVPYNAVHNPIQAPQAYVRRFSNPDPKRNTYLAMLAILDEGVGEILDVLDREGIGDSTLVIFLSDNGGARGTSAQNGALRDYKHSVYEGGIRVPFLLRWPRSNPRRNGLGRTRDLDRRVFHSPLGGRNQGGQRQAPRQQGSPPGRVRGFGRSAA